MIEVEQVRELLSKATPGPWYAEDSGKVWQLFARRITPLPEGTPDELRELMPDGMESHPLQLLKAAKEGTPYAEYWPESGDAALIAAAPDLAALALAQAAEIARMREALEGVLKNHTYYGPDPGTYLLCCSCNGVVAFPGHSGTRHAVDCPVPAIRSALKAAP